MKKSAEIAVRIVHRSICMFARDNTPDFVYDNFIVTRFREGGRYLPNLYSFLNLASV